MPLTPYQASYYAHELTLRRAADSVDKLAVALTDAQVDLNPHQVEAALFAYQNPLSRGVILADEVGLGKTIQAGLVLTNTRLSVIACANTCWSLSWHGRLLKDNR